MIITAVSIIIKLAMNTRENTLVEKSIEFGARIAKLVPRLRKCSVCKQCKQFNVRIGFDRRENGDVRWVYEGERCVNCGTLGSFLDWKIDYGPTAEMEQNL